MIINHVNSNVTNEKQQCRKIRGLNILVWVQLYRIYILYTRYIDAQNEIFLLFHVISIIII